MKYSLTKEDFDTVFEFAVKYHLEPAKSGFTRTSGASRGLGGVLDSFVRGKLVEIGVVRIVKSINASKEYILDFDIKPANEIREEPDLIEVVERAVRRKPKMFIEIKAVGASDRWVGLTEEQLNTSRGFGGENNVFVVGASIENTQPGKNAKEKDFVGSYLKEIANQNLFKMFADLQFAQVSIEYVLSGQDLDKFGKHFLKEGFLYETEVFEDAGPNDAKNILAGKIKLIKNLKNGDNLASYKVSAFPAPDFGNFQISGSANLFEKTNASSKVLFLECLSEVKVKNEVLGTFMLSKGKIYSFKTGTLGRNPVLARNNVWIAKRRVSQIVSEGKLQSPTESLKKIASSV